MQNFARKLLRYSRFTTSVHKFLPDNLKLWLKRKSVKELVSVNDLKPQFIRALKYLSVKTGTNLTGDYLEFGVCHGTSMVCMNQVLKKLHFDNIRMIGFDSFEGLPELEDKDDSTIWKKGQFKSDIEVTKYHLSKNGIDWSRTYLVKGWFSETLNDATKKDYKLNKACIIMIDCDIYSASKEALNFCLSLIKDVVVIVFDDWHSKGSKVSMSGQELAFSEFLNKNSYLHAEEFGSYGYDDRPAGKLFIVTNTKLINFNDMTGMTVPSVTGK